VNVKCASTMDYFELTNPHATGGDPKKVMLFAEDTVAMMAWWQEYHDYRAVIVKEEDNDDVCPRRITRSRRTQNGDSNGAFGMDSSIAVSGKKPMPLASKMVPTDAADATADTRVHHQKGRMERETTYLSEEIQEGVDKGAGRSHSTPDTGAVFQGGSGGMTVRVAAQRTDDENAGGGSAASSTAMSRISRRRTRDGTRARRNRRREDNCARVTAHEPALPPIIQALRRFNMQVRDAIRYCGNGSVGTTDQQRRKIERIMNDLNNKAMVSLVTGIFYPDVHFENPGAGEIDKTNRNKKIALQVNSIAMAFMYRTCQQGFDEMPLQFTNLSGAQVARIDGAGIDRDVAVYPSGDSLSGVSTGRVADGTDDGSQMQAGGSLAGE